MRRVAIVVGALIVATMSGGCGMVEGVVIVAKIAEQREAERFEREVLTLLAEGKQGEAEGLVEAYVPRHPRDYRAIFLHACLIRSRFNIADSLPLFQLVAKRIPNSDWGKCASLMASLDTKRDVEADMIVFSELAYKDGGSPICLWMLGVQGRTQGKHQAGISAYMGLLNKWQPGPVMVHQTYANVLDEKGRYEEALKHRRIAVEMEPAAWSIDGLANTLDHLKHYEESDAAHAKATELAPNRSSYWSNWSGTLLRQGKYDEAITKAQKAIELDAENWRGWLNWGCCLENQKQLIEARQKYQRAVSIDGADDYTRNSLRDVERKLEKMGVPKAVEDWAEN